ncbi:MAG: DotU family type IV/VI secretion system protein [Desulfobacteraceae bacterium]
MKFTAIDCVTDLFAYTYYISGQIRKSGADFELTKENYSRIIEQAQQCAKSSGISKKDFDRALFPVFAWIDETLLETSWEHRNQWVRNSLQKTYFNTTNAGEIFFRNLEKLGPEDGEIIEIYYYCLASGFKGNLYQPYQQNQLESYKEDTLNRLMQDEKAEVPGILFPKAGTSEIPETLRRKRWQGLGGLSFLLVMVSVILLAGLFYFYDQQIVEAMEKAGIYM